MSTTIPLLIITLFFLPLSGSEDAKSYSKELFGIHQGNKTALAALAKKFKQPLNKVKTDHAEVINKRVGPDHVFSLQSPVTQKNSKFSQPQKKTTEEDTVRCLAKHYATYQQKDDPENEFYSMHATSILNSLAQKYKAAKNTISKAKPFENDDLVDECSFVIERIDYILDTLLDHSLDTKPFKINPTSRKRHQELEPPYKTLLDKKECIHQAAQEVFKARIKKSSGIISIVCKE